MALGAYFPLLHVRFKFSPEIWKLIYHTIWHSLLRFQVLIPRLSILDLEYLTSESPFCGLIRFLFDLLINSIVYFPVSNLL